jgi:hypothetical protein
LPGEASDRFNLVQETMINTDEKCEQLKRILQNKELRELLHKVFEIEARLEQEERSGPVRRQ